MSDSEEHVSASQARSKREPVASRMRRWRKPIRFLLLLLLGMVMYNVISGMLSRRYDASLERDSESGVLVGAEPRLLGPEDASAAVLLVHGFVGAGNNFGELPDRLADSGVRVRVMRLPGHGTTPTDFANTPSSEFLLAVLWEYRELQKNHEHVFVAGHSMGAALSTLLASIDPPAGLILAAPYYTVTHQWYYGLRVETWTKLTAPLVRWTYKSRNFVRVKRREVVDDIVSYRWIPAEGSKTLVALGEYANDPVVLEMIEAPTLMIVANDDQAASPESAVRNFEILASEDKTLVRLENSDHHLFWDYDREIAIAAVLDFVNERATDSNTQEGH